MQELEYRNAKSHLANTASFATQKDLEKYLEALIAVKGHAWCMDVKSERKKIAKLIASTLF
jgi:hypothetical protein